MILVATPPSSATSPQLGGVGDGLLDLGPGSAAWSSRGVQPHPRRPPDWQFQFRVCGIAASSCSSSRSSAAASWPLPLRDQLMVSLRERTLIEAARGIDTEAVLGPLRQMMRADSSPVVRGERVPALLLHRRRPVRGVLRDHFATACPRRTRWATGTGACSRSRSSSPACLRPAQGRSRSWWSRRVSAVGVALFARHDRPRPRPTTTSWGSSC